MMAHRRGWGGQVGMTRGFQVCRVYSGSVVHLASQGKGPQDLEPGGEVLVGQVGEGCRKAACILTWVSAACMARLPACSRSTRECISGHRVAAGREDPGQELRRHQAVGRVAISHQAAPDRISRTTASHVMLVITFMSQP